MVLHLRRRSHFPQGLAGRRSDRRSVRERPSKEIFVIAQRIQERPGRSADYRRRRARADSRCAADQSSRCICWRLRPPMQSARRPRLSPSQAGPLSTDADRVMEQYRKLGEAAESRLRRARQRRAELQRSREDAEVKPRQPSLTSHDGIFRKTTASRVRKERSSKFNVGGRSSAFRWLAILFQVYVPRFVPYLLSGTAAAGDGIFFADAAVAGGGGVVRRGHRPGAGFAVASSSGDVRHREDAGGILRGVGEPALRCGESVCGWCWDSSFSSSMQFSIGCWSGRCWGRRLQFELVQTTGAGVLNAVVAVFLYQFLDKLKITG